MAEPTLRTVLPQGEPSDMRGPTAQVESVLTRLLADNRKERRDLMAQLSANQRTEAKLTAALLGLGVEEVGE